MKATPVGRWHRRRKAFSRWPAPVYLFLLRYWKKLAHPMQPLKQPVATNNAINEISTAWKILQFFIFLAQICKLAQLLSAICYFHVSYSCSSLNPFWISIKNLDTAKDLFNWIFQQSCWRTMQKRENFNFFLLRLNKGRKTSTVDNFLSPWFSINTNCSNLKRLLSANKEFNVAHDFQRKVAVKRKCKAETWDIFVFALLLYLLVYLGCFCAAVFFLLFSPHLVAAHTFSSYWTLLLTHFHFLCSLHFFGFEDYFTYLLAASVYRTSCSVSSLQGKTAVFGWRYNKLKLSKMKKTCSSEKINFNSFPTTISRAPNIHKRHKANHSISESANWELRNIP